MRIRIAILSAGKSLLKTWSKNHGKGYNTVIGVNSALFLFDVDCLVAGDYSTYVRLGDRRPIWGAWSMGDDAKRAQELWPDTPVSRFDLLPGITQLPEHFDYSIQGAMAVAQHIGADEVDLYGCDMVPGTDCADKDGEDRRPERWERESRKLSQSVALLRATGCTVRRITAFPWE